MRPLIVLFAALVLSGPIAVVAQEIPSPDLFPGASDLGDDWVLISARDADDAYLADHPSFDRLSIATYLGPSGGRVVTARVRVKEGPSATRESWDNANQSFDQYLITFKADYSSEARLETEPLVNGCATMRRLDGADSVIPAVPVGLSLCAADPNAIVFAYVSGSVDGLTGHAASDHVIELVLARSEAAIVASP